MAERHATVPARTRTTRKEMGLLAKLCFNEHLAAYPVYRPHPDLSAFVIVDEAVLLSTRAPQSVTPPSPLFPQLQYHDT